LSGSATSARSPATTAPIHARLRCTFSHMALPTAYGRSRGTTASHGDAEAWGPAVPSARASRWVVVDRLFPSSQTHHGCGGRLLGEKLAKQLSCERCGAVVDRDENAAKNIRDWPDPADPGPVGASALREPGPPDGGTDGRSDVRGTVHRARRRKTSLSGVSVRREPMLANASGGTPQGVHLHDNYRSLRCTGSECGMRALAEGGPRTYLRSRCPDRYGRGVNRGRLLATPSRLQSPSGQSRSDRSPPGKVLALHGSAPAGMLDAAAPPQMLEGIYCRNGRQSHGCTSVDWPVMQCGRGREAMGW
jgi:hypothetical protein